MYNNWRYYQKATQPDDAITDYRQLNQLRNQYHSNIKLPNVFGNQKLLFSKRPKVAVLGSYGWMRNHRNQDQRYRSTFGKFRSWHIMPILPVDNYEDNTPIWYGTHNDVPMIGVLASNFQDVPQGNKNERDYSVNILRNHGLIMSPFSNREHVNQKQGEPYDARNVWMSHFADMILIPRATFSRKIQSYLKARPGTNIVHDPYLSRNFAFKEPGANAALYVHNKYHIPLLYIDKNNDQTVNEFLAYKHGAVNAEKYFKGLAKQKQANHHVNYEPKMAARSATPMPKTFSDAVKYISVDNSANTSRFNAEFEKHKKLVRNREKHINYLKHVSYNNGKKLYLKNPKSIKHLKQREEQTANRLNSAKAKNNGILPKTKEASHLYDESIIDNFAYQGASSIEAKDNLRNREIKTKHRIDKKEGVPEFATEKGKKFNFNNGYLYVAPPEHVVKKDYKLVPGKVPKTTTKRFKRNLSLLNHNHVPIVTSEDPRHNNLTAQFENKSGTPFGLYVSEKDLKSPQIKKDIKQAKINGSSIKIMRGGDDRKRNAHAILNSTAIYLPKLTLRKSHGLYYPKEPSATLALNAVKRAHKPLFYDPKNNSKKANELLNKVGARPIQDLEDKAYTRNQKKVDKFVIKFTKNMVATAKRLKKARQNKTPGKPKPYLQINGSSKLLKNKHKMALISFGDGNSIQSSNFRQQKSRIRHTVNQLEAAHYTILSTVSTNTDNQIATNQTIIDHAPSVAIVTSTDKKSLLRPNLSQLKFYQGKEPDTKLIKAYNLTFNPKKFKKQHPKISSRVRKLICHQLKHKIDLYHNQPKGVIKVNLDDNTSIAIQKAIQSPKNKKALQTVNPKDIANSMKSMALRSQQDKTLVDSSSGILVLGAKASEGKLIDKSLDHDANNILENAKKNHKAIYFIPKNNTSAARKILEHNFGAKPVTNLIGNLQKGDSYKNTVSKHQLIPNSFKKTPHKMKHPSLKKTWDQLPDGNGNLPNKSKNKSKDKDVPDF